MFTLIDGLPDHVIGIDISGKVTAKDYQDTFTPAIAEKLKSHNRIDVVCRFEKGWEGFEAGVIWEDLRTGLGNLGHWGRVAIVVDSDWMENTIDIGRYLWPGHLRHFDLDEFDRACDWVGEQDRTTVECSIAENGVLQINPAADQSLTEDDFVKIRGVVDAHLGNQKSVTGILIETRKFPGWESFGAMLSHLKFVRDHHRQVKRIALVTDSPMGKFADYAVDHFIKAEVKSFDYADRKKAELWIAGQSG
jgi:hypothetical protein